MPLKFKYKSATFQYAFGEVTNLTFRPSCLQLCAFSGNINISVSLKDAVLYFGCNHECGEHRGGVGTDNAPSEEYTKIVAQVLGALP